MAVLIIIAIIVSPRATAPNHDLIIIGAKNVSALSVIVPVAIASSRYQLLPLVWTTDKLPITTGYLKQRLVRNSCIIQYNGHIYHVVVTIAVSAFTRATDTSDKLVFIHTAQLCAVTTILVLAVVMYKSCTHDREM